MLMFRAYRVLYTTRNSPLATNYHAPFSIVYILAAIFLLLSVKDLYRTGPFKEKLELIGKNSMDYFAVHRLFMRPLWLWSLTFIPPKLMWLTNFGVTLITPVLSCLFVVLKQKVLARIRAKKI